MQKWIAASRLRTLPLAFSCIILGSFLAAFYGFYNTTILVLSLLTTLLYQVLSNFANDYGDGVKGTDDNRTGEKRSVASGAISAQQMKTAVILFSVLSFISGTALSILGTNGLPVYVTVIFITLGALAIWAAIKYTVGNKAYGYRGLGDIYVLFFFGWLGVLGSFYLQAHFINFWVFLPASAIGMLAAGVLNLNNMRDIEEDKKNGKITLAVRMGLKNAKHYQFVLLVGALVLTTIFILHETTSAKAYTFLLAAPTILFTLVKSYKAKQEKALDALLKPLALSTLLYSILLGVGLLLSV